MKTHDRSKMLVMYAMMMFLPLISLGGKESKEKSDKSTEKVSCLEISGRISDNGGNCMVYLIRNNQAIDSVQVNGNHSFRFKLKRDEFYTIRISRAGYISRSVSISTELSSNIEIKSAYRFHFVTKLTSKTEAKQTQDDYFDFPVALIAYHDKKDHFTYSHKYTSVIKDKMYPKEPIKQSDNLYSHKGIHTCF